MELHWILSALLLSTRFAAATALTPVFGSVSLPGTVRVVLALTFGTVLALIQPTAVLTAIDSMSTARLLVCMINEALIGAAFSLGFLAAYSATQVAGRVLDVQIGFGVAGILNPSTGTFSPLLGSLFGMVGIALFLAMDGHHQLLRALALSTEIIKPGGAAAAINAMAIIRQSSLMFVYGLMLAAPVMLALLLIDIAMAIYARSLPQLNVLVLSFGIKVAVGTLLLAVSLKWAQWAFVRLYELTFEYWSQQVLAP